MYVCAVQKVLYVYCTSVDKCVYVRHALTVLSQKWGYNCLVHFSKEYTVQYSQMYYNGIQIYTKRILCKWKTPVDICHCFLINFPHKFHRTTSSYVIIFNLRLIWASKYPQVDVFSWLPDNIWMRNWWSILRPKAKTEFCNHLQMFWWFQINIHVVLIFLFSL